MSSTREPEPDNSGGGIARLITSSSPKEEELILRALIFAAGTLSDWDKERIEKHQGDVVIAADAGARNCISMGITVDYAIGDFDSLDPGELEFLISQNTKVIRFSDRKDYTDLELALQYAVNLGIEHIIVFGAFGLRWDHTFANLMLLTSPDYRHVNIKLIDSNQEIFLIHRDQPAYLHGNPGDIVSLIPVHGNVTGVTTFDLEYPLNQETLFPGATRTVSNVMIHESVKISIEEGLLICFHIRQRTPGEVRP